MGVLRFAVLAVAIIAAGAAALLVLSLTSQEGESPVAPVRAQRAETVRVLVAVNTLQRGERLEIEDLRWQAWPETALTENLVTDAGGSNRINDYEGAVVRSLMIAGEPVSDGKVAFSGSGGFMSAIIEPGMRAATIEIDEVTGAGGFVLPGDRVDVVYVRRGDGDINRATSQTILTNIRVLAIDQLFGDGGEDATIVGSAATLELTPKDAEFLLSSASQGELSLILRSLETGADLSSIREPRQKGVRIIRYGVGSSAVSGAR